MPTPRPPRPPRLTFTTRHRLTQALDFKAAYDTNVSRARAPLIIFGRPNGTPLPRLGLSVPRRIGNAVVRNRVKRRIREAFRLHQSKLPAGVDLVVNVRPHAPLTVAEYALRLIDAAASLARELHRRAPSSPKRAPE